MMRPLQEMRILAVDDDPRSLKLSRVILESIGYREIQTAASGEEGLGLLRSSPPDLILLDIIMPGMNGYQFCREVRRNEATRHIPVLMITGMPSKEDKTIQESFEAGATDFISKPIRSAEFLARVKSALMIKQAHDCLQEEISKRKQAEEVLRESEKKYRELVQNANSIILRMDSGGHILFFNEFAQSFFGYSEKEILGKHMVGSIVPETDRYGRSLRTLFEDLLRHPGRYAAYESRNVRRNGEEVWIAWTNKVIRDGEGKVMGYLCIGSDMTGRRRAEEALHASEARYRNMFENMSSGVAVYQVIGDGEDFIFTDFNKAAEKIDRVKKEEILGKSVVQVFPGVKEFGLFSVFEQVWKTGRPTHHPAGLYRDERLTGWRKNYVYKLPTGEIVSLYRDETERKQAEMRIDRLNAVLRAVIGINQLIVREKNRDRLLKGVCESLTQTRGYHNAWIVLFDQSRKLIASVESGWGKTFSAMLENLKAGKMPRCARAALTQKGVSLLENVPSACADCPLADKYQGKGVLSVRMEYEGNIYGILTASVPSSFTIDHEELELMEEVAADLAFALHNIIQEEERKRIEREKERLEAQLHQAQKMEAIGTLAGGIAHDFNNILGAIIGYAEMMELFDVPEDSPMQPSLKEILKASYRARDLVQQILTFSRRTEQERRPVRLGSICKETLQFLRASLPRTIEIRPFLGDQTDTVLADPTQMHQVLMNLCTNAAYAMQEKGGVLEIELTGMDLDAGAVKEFIGLKAGPYLRLAVKDTGHGMNRSTMDRIFDPYFTTKRQGQGTGMGLAVALGIVRSHGGTMTVESEAGKGSTFHVFLPLMTKDTVESEDEEAMPLIGGEGHVLLVDDEEALVDVGQAMLERLGYTATGKTSSIEALEVFRAEPDRFDLVITDLTMPRMTGVELARCLLLIRPDIPIILCTGFSERVTKESAEMAGIKELAIKPISTRNLSETIRRVLNRRK